MLHVVVTVLNIISNAKYLLSHMPITPTNQTSLAPLSSCVFVSVRGVSPCRDGASASGRGVLSMHGLSHSVVRVNTGTNLTSLTLQDCGQVLPGGTCLCLSVCLSVCLSLFDSAHITEKPHARTSLNLLCMLPVTVAWSYSDGVAICCVFPLLRMTLCF